MNSKSSVCSHECGQCTRSSPLRPSLGLTLALLFIAGYSPVNADEAIKPVERAPGFAGEMGPMSAWEVQQDSVLAEIYGLGAKHASPEPNGELAIILWDEARGGERRPVRSVSDDGKGNIQGNTLRMMTR